MYPPFLFNVSVPQTTKMCLFFFVSFLGFLISFPSTTSGCRRVDLIKSKVEYLCKESSHSAKYVEIDGRRVPFGTRNMRIQLEEPPDKFDLVCQEEAWAISLTKGKGKGNQVRVTYVNDTIIMKVFWCDRFDGPTQAGLRCAVEAFSSACPGRVSDNHTCVYEIKTRRFSSDTVRKAVEVKTEVAVTVRGKAGVSAGVTHTNEREVVNAYTVDSRSYIVIPAGYRFCSFSKASSSKDDLAATGFKWTCNLPTFVQTTMITGRCTDLKLCESRSPCSSADSQPSGNGKRSAEAQPVTMLLALFLIVSSNLANLL